MKKRHPKQHRPVTFVGESETMATPVVEQRVLTAEGYKRRAFGPCTERPRSIYRGRRQGKGE